MQCTAWKVGVSGHMWRKDKPQNKQSFMQNDCHQMQNNQRKSEQPECKAIQKEMQNYHKHLHKWHENVPNSSIVSCSSMWDGSQNNKLCANLSWDSHANVVCKEYMGVLHLMIIWFHLNFWGSYSCSSKTFPFSSRDFLTLLPSCDCGCVMYYFSFLLSSCRDFISVWKNGSGECSMKSLMYHLKATNSSPKGNFMVIWSC